MNDGRTIDLNHGLRGRRWVESVPRLGFKQLIVVMRPKFLALQLGETGSPSTDVSQSRRAEEGQH